MIDRLPAGATSGSYADLDSLRAQLGLPADADPGGAKDTEQVERFGVIAGSIMVQLTIPNDPVAEAVDGSQVHAAAGNAEGGYFAVIETDQPFDEIADELERAGFKRDGDVLESRTARGFNIVADGGGQGIVILGQEPADVEAAAAGKDPPGAVSNLLTGLDTAERAAITFARGGCVESMTLAANAEPPDAELVYATGAPATVDNFQSGAVAGAGVELGEPSAAGNKLTVPVSREGDAVLQPLSSLAQVLLPTTLYLCPGT